MVHAVGRERARRQQGCGGGKLGPPAMVDAAALSATEGQSEKGRWEGERVNQGELGRSV